MSVLFPSIDKMTENDSLKNIPYKPIFNTIEYTIETIVDKIVHVDELDENEIKSIIYRQHSLILNYDLFLSNAKNRHCAQILFSNKRFLTILLDIIGLLDLSNEEIGNINKLVFDYYILPNRDNEIIELLLQISFEINNVLITQLSAVLGINRSRALAMIARSSFREEKRIHRVNSFLTKSDLELTVQNIIDIFSILYPRFTSLFIHSMLEVKQPDMSLLQQKNFDAISSALLLMLNAMTSKDMKTTLLDYGYMLKLIKTDILVLRFSLKSSICNPRMIEIINDIEINNTIDKIIIP